MNLGNLFFTMVDTDKEVVKSMKKYFGNLMNFQLVRSNIAQIPEADCVICPGNSYGFMNQGVEKAINILIDGMEDRVQNVINNIYYGEQPVGTCAILDTHDSRFTYVAHVPVSINQDDVSKTRNAYLGFRAFLISVLNHNKISNNKITSIICTPFCTGIGKMNPEESLRQMRIAYNLIDLGLPCSRENEDLIRSLI